MLQVSGHVLSKNKRKNEKKMTKDGEKTIIQALTETLRLLQINIIYLSSLLASNKEAQKHFAVKMDKFKKTQKKMFELFKEQATQEGVQH